MSEMLSLPHDLPWIPPTEDGWMFDIEVATMTGFVSILNAAGLEGDILEIGAYKGRSTGALVVAAGKTRVTVVDTFAGGGELDMYDIVDMEKSFYGHINRMFGRVPENLEVIKGDSHVVLPQLALNDRKYKLALVDGDHSENGCFADFVNCWALLVKGGYMFIDDINFTAVQAAYRRFASKKGPNELSLGLVTNKLGYVKKL